MSKAKLGDIFAIMILLIWVTGIGGWIANIYKLLTVSTEIASWGAMEVARCIGVFVAPLGAVLGFF